jgi:hypothetical protein
LLEPFASNGTLADAADLLSSIAGRKAALEPAKESRCHVL